MDSDGQLHWDRAATTNSPQGQALPGVQAGYSLTPLASPPPTKGHLLLLGSLEDLVPTQSSSLPPFPGLAEIPVQWAGPLGATENKDEGLRYSQPCLLEGLSLSCRCLGRYSVLRREVGCGGDQVGYSHTSPGLERTQARVGSQAQLFPW